ncbi:serine/threonine-protein kinase [Corallococcus sicarius]|uniref:Serine/threonine protein kinase n=1 Tax=Corallococcus sicarius TaxID=2316726 RepID=A0A3A8NKI4_9BACT|nr:serine/threonine-protein kinase [Corallococcus sicarius]RKH39944.1 serine/threonine protein kinase [Corallococcus sicarius]
MSALKEPFVLVEKFDAGGLGELFRCRDANQVAFAAKFPKDMSPEAQQMLLDEERRLMRHQGANVVRYLQSVRHPDGRRGFAMEMMDGSLAALVSREGAIEPRRALGLFRQMVRGLAEVHASAHGAFHGDIKLANVLLRGEAAKLADFGLARGGVGQTMQFGAHRGGTPGYMPPEGMTSPRGDVYSAGVVLWGMLSGREPHAVEGPTPRLPLRPKLFELLEDMLNRDANRRPSLPQVLQRLEAVEAEYGLLVRVTASAPQSQGTGLGGVLMGTAFVAGAAWLLSSLLGGGKEWDPQVGRFRGADGRFKPAG